MPQKLTVSTLFHPADKSGSLRADLDRYGQEHGIGIVQQEFDYTTGWSDFMRMAIYGGNLDVSEIGSTWVNDFAAMKVLRPFAAPEVQKFNLSRNFAPSVWASGSSYGSLWAIPWTLDFSLFCYQRDLLEKAGIEEAGAFQTPERFEQTLQKLQESGSYGAWIIPTTRSYVNIHNLAMWLWQAGEDFIDKEGKTVLFDQPGVRSAILSFLRLYRFIPKEMYHLAEGDADQLFNDGKVAVVIGGPWNILHNERMSKVGPHLGLAIPFGCCYTGGSSLIVWNRTNQPAAALELIAHLTSREFQTAIPKRAGMLPGRPDSLDSFPLSDPSFSPLLVQALKTGRSLPRLGLWGLIEDRLVNALPKLWDDLLASPNPDLGALYDEHIASLTTRLNIILSKS
jgi:ABC-type glycerol-3-phosphate transport system substrate-binding protein